MKFISLILLLLPLRPLLSEGFPTVKPDPLIITENLFGHHILVAEKSSHRLFLFKNHKGHPQLINSYQMATGKKAGDKKLQGDFKTPEGIYKITDFLSKEALLDRYGKEGEIYGSGAFVMDFPNPLDRKMKKTGGGIWLHSTNDETRIEKGLDSRGCLVIHNEDLKDISQYIELNKTHIVVLQTLGYISEKVHQNTQKNIKKLILDWSQSWADENLDRYLTHYDKQSFRSSSNLELKQFRQYKKRIFSAKGKPKIQLKNISVFKTPRYALAVFLQDYQSNTIQDIGIKTLYLKQNASYEWKIVSENWSPYRIKEEKKVAFFPPMKPFGPEKDDNKEID
jgi:murein L,D-transpeptidase YafK